MPSYRCPTPTHAEAAFYSSFTACDTASMEEIWGPDDVVCIHPGSAPLIGRSAVIKSWRHIMLEGGTVTLRNELLCETLAGSIAIHVVREVLYSADREAVVLATNIYKRYSEGWKIIEHHASQPTLQPRPGSKRRSSTTLQ